MNRFSRQELLIGTEGNQKLDQAKVAVIGLGGVGAYTVEALARAGVGWLILVDYDEVCLTNTNRQLHALKGNIGRPKVEVMEERVKAINPEAVVVSWKSFITTENMEAILHGEIDYVVDAIDTVSSKVALIQYCVEHKIPIISAMGAGNKFDPLAFKVADISKTTVCPLAKSVRKLLRERGITQGVKVVYSTETPVEPRADVPTCHQGCICPHKDEAVYNCTKKRAIPGSMSYVPPIAGLIMAGQVIRDIVGV
ncbi:MAG TPA: tRNA threonylcarbamoyladenosine dehydratase [Bacillota bacterium]|nr:tRNA threonylcarbamoyladenosine dehydratase [Bacillota bacterium]